MSTIEHFIFGVRYAEKSARERREGIDHRIAKDIEFDPRNAKTLRGITRISDEANRDARATLDSLLEQLASLLNMLDEKKGADDAEAK